MGLGFGGAQGDVGGLGGRLECPYWAHKSLLQTSRTKSAYRMRMQYMMRTESGRKYSHRKNPSNWVTGEGILSPTLWSVTW